ncbi:histidine--tRNA ligase [Candidatus Woesearchaeota archaeon]|jgi:histidyl-tRNA synthetase|nr:histidine--tRNA ligase [Candidatus Woesearchaeota archaeon]
MQTPKGTRDYFGTDAKKFGAIVSSFKNAFETFGFDRVSTPNFEYSKLLKGKYGEDEKLIYEFKDRSGRGLALRYDLTVPLARVVGNTQFPLPAKFYNIGKVFRYDNPQKGRKREFVQADIDVVGSNSALCDAELISCMSYGFYGLRIKPIFRVNNRMVMNQIFSELGYKKKDFVTILRAIDKLDKIGVAGVKRELEGKGLNKVPRLLKLIRTRGSLTTLKSAIKGLNVDLTPFESLSSDIRNLQMNPTRVEFDLSLARGLDYYTGNVYEIDIGQKMSVGGGGRYDSLVRNLTGKDLTGVGISIGITRLFDLVSDKIKVNDSKVSVVGINTNPLEIVNSLRINGIVTNYDLNSRNLRSAMNYANKTGSNYVVLVGERELKSKKFVLRDMSSGKEEKLTINQIISKFK